MTNGERGAFRLWCAAAFAWVIGCTWLLDLPCSLGPYSAPWCLNPFDQFWLVPAAYWRLTVIVVLPPVIVLVLGGLLAWTWRGFRAPPSR
ncbi:hypothetical protein [Methylobacterium radiotolerans]|uniref:hypothetical protein n=1 Tax=Methylobacterium radiotolerans TaxID=31998 RepID=UPI0015F43D7A|nr:hypothetical protein [Methylobacterium radiotolerans]